MTNKTTTICCAVALLATTAATPALSQSKNFAGPSIAVHTGYTGTDTKMSFDAAEDGYLSFGENDVTYGADLAYSFPVDNNFLISVGATYDFDKIKAGTAAAVGEDESGDDDLSLKLSLKDHYSFYIEPTYAFNNSTALFAKLAYHQAKGSVNLSGGDTATGSKNFEGWGYGFGIKTFLNNNVFVKAEASLVEYDKETYGTAGDAVSFKPETVSGLISIGYKF
jgi:opacity protein-like surface antigen